MFVLPAGIFAGVPGLGWDDTLHNWLFAWYLFLRDEPADGPGPR